MASWLHVSYAFQNIPLYFPYIYIDKADYWYILLPAYPNNYRASEQLSLIQYVHQLQFPFSYFIIFSEQCQGVLRLTPLSLQVQTAYKSASLRSIPKSRRTRTKSPIRPITGRHSFFGLPRSVQLPFHYALGSISNPGPLVHFIRLEHNSRI